MSVKEEWVLFLAPIGIAILDFVAAEVFGIGWLNFVGLDCLAVSFVFGLACACPYMLGD